ncbi:MAG: hypothetical protein OIN88_16545 [Candidatus Methanoperedens sp.]|nr:hypothetical protein [Candidatus Methanoperedens sp.]
MNYIIYKIENESPIDEYIFNFIFSIIGVIGKKFDDSGNYLDIYYGNNFNENDCKIMIRKNNNDIIWNDLLEGNINIKNFNKVIPFDIINAIGLFLTDRVNSKLSDESFDLFDRLRFDMSFQHKKKISHIPIVNIYTLFFKEILNDKLSIDFFPLWPFGKKCAIALSHDVDTPDKYSIIKNFPINIFNLLKRGEIIRTMHHLKHFVIYGYKYIKDKNKNNFWLFNEIMQEESRLGMKSCFYFASMNQFGEYGCDIDVSYSIKNKKFGDIFKTIRSNGFEIGLHASYFALDSLTRFKKEKLILSEAVGLEIIGLRHHYWHIGKDEELTLANQSRAGFKYDSSIAFNEEMGFRRNVAFPYYPWNSAERFPINILQLPVFLMDGNLFYREIEVQDAVNKVADMIQVIKNYNGLGVIDWHVRTSYPSNKEYYKWGQAYLKIIEYLSSCKEIWVTSPGEIYNWLKDREKKLNIERK